MSDHQYFTAEPTSLTIERSGALAIFCGDAPRKVEGGTSRSLRGPLFIMPQEMWEDADETAKTAAAVLNQSAHRFFKSARPAAVVGSVRLDAATVADLAEDGCWRTCSGCYETEDGHPVGEYLYSHAMQCPLGSGCRECGGLGAYWDNTDYAQMAAEMRQEDEVAAPAVNVPPPCYVQTIQSKLCRFQECAEDGEDVDIGRSWLDALTTLGLLERLPNRSAAWSLTDAGAAALEGGGS